MPVPEHFEALPGFFDHRVLVPRVCRRELPRGDLKNPQPDRNEHLLRISGADLVVYGLQYSGRTVMPRRRLADQSRGYHHEQGCRHSFARYIRDDEAQMPFVDHEEIVEVAADHFGRGHRRVQAEFLPLGKLLRKRACLDAVGQLQLGADPLLLQRERLTFPDRPPVMPHHCQNIGRRHSNRSPQGMRDKTDFIQINCSDRAQDRQ